MNQRWRLVDALRGLAAFAVVLFHIYMSSYIAALIPGMPAWLAAAMHEGVNGVAVFFVLSGFVIAHSLSRETATVGLVGRFALRRSLRLDPPYWTAIIISLAAAALPALLSHDQEFPPISAGQLVAHALYLQSLLQEPVINVVFWTLCLEVQFYLIYVVILVLTQRRGQATALCAIMLISLLWPTDIVTATQPGLFLPLWYSWLLGVAAYFTWRNTVAIPGFAAFVGIILAAGLYHGDHFAVASAATGAFLFWAARTERLERLDWKWLQFLGLISYSLYLIHTPVLTSTFRLGYAITGRSPVLEAVWATIVIALCLGSAALMWWLVERPSMKLARKVPLSKSKLPHQPTLASCHSTPDQGRALAGMGSADCRSPSRSM